ncbi:hypothetical protein BLOT_005502 [Blomia tropicalis]|nr:hypothetical protein BLOT_005502 [Blomia tropicalis]
MLASLSGRHKENNEFFVIFKTKKREKYIQWNEPNRTNLSSVMCGLSLIHLTKEFKSNSSNWKLVHIDDINF